MADLLTLDNTNPPDLIRLYVEEFESQENITAERALNSLVQLLSTRRLTILDLIKHLERYYVTTVDKHRSYASKLLSTVLIRVPELELSET